MDVTALILLRIQFAFTISFHIIFPAFTIGLAAWLTVLEAMQLATGRPAYRALVDNRHGSVWDCGGWRPSQIAHRTALSREP